MHDQESTGGAMERWFLRYVDTAPSDICSYSWLGTFRPAFLPSCYAIAIPCRIICEREADMPDVGQTLGRYEIVDKLGEGGMGVVYKARDARLNRFVALKLMLGAPTDPDHQFRRFAQEAKAASALNHPNIITVYDIASDEGTLYIVMEYVVGKTLRQVIPRQGMRLGEAFKIAVQLADALSAAGSAGIVHRDLKPGNIMVTENGLVKVLDFGLAKFAVAEPAAGAQPSHCPLR